MKNFTKIFALLCITALYNTSFSQLAYSGNMSELMKRESIENDITAPRTDLLRSTMGDFIFGPNSRMRFKVIEEESGVKNTFFKIADLPYIKSDGRLIPQELEEGTYTILYYSVDNNQNQEQIRRDEIYLDKSGPKMNPSFSLSPVSYDEGVPVFSADVQLVLEVADEMAQVQKVVYQVNDLPEVESSQSAKIDLSEELKKTKENHIKVKVSAYDTFYNINTELIEFKILR